jgi:hypothetical protein
MSETTFLPVITEAKSYSSTSVQSAVVATNKVRLLATTDAFIEMGEDPTAEASGAGVGTPLVAGVPEYFDIIPGHKVAVIRSANDGILYITQLRKPKASD